MNAEISITDQNINRTKLWIDSLKENDKLNASTTNKNKFLNISPDGDLSLLFSNHTLNDTPRRRLWTFFDSDSLSPDSAAKSNPIDKNCDVKSTISSKNGKENDFTKIRNVSSPYSENFFNPNLLISPAPSSVFYDDDLLQDSGYPKTRNGADEDGFMEEMFEIDENDSSNNLQITDYRSTTSNVKKSQHTPKIRKSLFVQKCKDNLYVFNGSGEMSSCESDIKRHKSLTESFSCTNLKVQRQSGMARCHSDAEIIHAVQIGDENRTLIGDFSGIHALPLLDAAGIGDLKCIDANTVRDLFESKFENVKNFVFVDCRYPYEYFGGHIRGALNVYTKDQLKEKFFLPVPFTKTTEDRKILVFYCEFSKERGPRMSRFLRAEDRRINHLQYPKLFYPEIYLLDGGYKNFYEKFKQLCDPKSYTPMVHEDHAEDLRKLRVKSKSWSSFVADKSTTKLVRRPGLNRELFN